VRFSCARFNDDDDDDDGDDSEADTEEESGGIDHSASTGEREIEAYSSLPSKRY
jgi:hypothetical protein